MAQATWMSAMPERRSDLGLHDVRDAPSASPRLPPLSEIARYGHPGGHYNGALPRDRRMPVDYNGLGPGQHGLYGQHDAGDAHAFSPDVNARNHFQEPPATHGYAGDDATPHQASYDIYSANSSDPLGSFGQRYRSNTSSSSSLAGGYGMGSDSLYPPPSFPEHMPPMGPPGGHSGYDMQGMAPYGNSKRSSPLTPNDTPSFSAFSGPDTGMKDFSHLYPDQTLDRRSSNVSIASSYHSDYQEDYGAPVQPTLNVGYGLPLPLQDRTMPYQGNGRSAQAPSPLHTQMNVDGMQGVSPHATNMFRSPNGSSDYDHFLPSPGADLSLSQPSMDAHLVRMKIQSGPATDLASFMRYAFVMELLE